MEIGFKNLRSLKDTQLIKLRPLTILLGQNSSGKSTFLRTFPLLKQSMETRTVGPLLWYGRLVDFGEFKNALNDKTKDDFIEFLFNIKFNQSTTRHNFRTFNPIIQKLSKYNDCYFKIKVKGDKENKTYTHSIEIVYNDFKIEILFGKNNNIDNIKIDNKIINIENISYLEGGNSFLPRLIVKRKDNYFIADREFQFASIKERINKIAKKKYADTTIIKILNLFDISSNISLFDSITKENKNNKFQFSKHTQNWNINDEEYLNFKSIIVSCFIPVLFEKIDTFLSELTNNINYIAPLRANGERYYRPQDLSVNEVDFQGKNLPLVLRNLNQSERISFENWCNENFNFYPKTSISGGNITLNVKFKDQDSEHNISDLGFGFSQILPIITQIWTGIVNDRKINIGRTKKIRIYAIEQPELHLHPKIQARLIDSIIKVINLCKEKEIEIIFILETHSETIINSIGTRIYKKVIDPEDVNVLLFEREASASIINESKYLSDGSLENWPFGFFDEELI